MTSSLERELSDILEKIHSILKRERGITLQEARDLYFEAKKKYLMADEEERNQQEVKLGVLDIFFQVGKISEKFIEEWQNNKFDPHDSELNLLKEGCDEVLEAFDNHFKESLLFFYGKQRFSTQHAKVEEKVSKIRKLISNSMSAKPPVNLKSAA